MVRTHFITPRPLYSEVISRPHTAQAKYFNLLCADEVCFLLTQQQIRDNVCNILQTVYFK
jgi:hypothetical protein